MSASAWSHRHSLLPLLLSIVILSACAKHPWHYTPPPGPTTPSQKFDAHYDTTHLDPNTAPRNVDWFPQTQGLVPNPDQCNHGQPYSSGCTQDTIFKDKPDLRHDPFCFIGKITSGSPYQSFFGHADWMVAQYNGSIGWFNYGADFDYDLFLVPGADNLPSAPGNQHGITTNNNYVADDKKNPQYIEMEFDSDETNLAFTKGWWNDFKTSGENDDVDAMADLLHPPNPEGKRTLGCGAAVGLFGLDCDHGCRSELHPIYGLAIQRKDDPNDNQWSILARNWGTGGYCSQYNDQLAEGSISILLPYTSSQQPTSAEIQNFTASAYSDSVKFECPTIYFNNGQTFVNLTLPAPDQQPVASFTLTLHWPSGAQPSACTQLPLEPKAMAFSTARQPTAEPKGEDSMRDLLYSAAQRKNPSLKRLNFERDILPELPQTHPSVQKLKTMRKMVALPQARCETIDVKTGTPPPVPLPKTAIHNLAKDGPKQIRDDGIRSFICKNLDATKLPPGIDEQQYRKACKGAK